MKPIKKRFWAVSWVVRDYRRALLAVLGLVLSPFLASLFACSAPDRLRYAGFGLQILGLLVVAQGLHDTRRMFGQPGLAEQFKSFFRRLTMAVVKGPIEVFGTANIVIGAGRVAGSGTATAQPAKVPTTVEEKLEILTQEMASLRTSLEQFREGTNQSVSEVRQSLERERQERAKDTSDIQALLKKRFVGGLGLETAGLVWLLAGTLFASLPQELSGLVAWIPC